MSRRVYLYILLGLFLMVVKGGYAMKKESGMDRDTVRCVAIRFEFRLNEVDSMYAENQRTIECLDTLLTDSTNASKVQGVKIASYVLPESNATFESWLAGMRVATVNNFLKQRYPYLNRAAVRTVQVKDSTEIDKARTIDRDLNRADIQIVWKCPVAAVANMDGAVSSINTHALFVDESPKPIEKEYAGATEVRSIGRETVLAVKNNLLYDLVLAPNLEIELPIGKQWSLNTEYKCPWWLNSSRDFCYQLLSGGVEVRYWLGKRHERLRLTGHFVGLYAEGGVYDFQFGGDGYQGKYYGASGLTYGYVKPIARHLALEFSFGVGYLTTEYRKYTPREGELVHKDRGRYNFIGPTKAKVSLVWLITTRR